MITVLQDFFVILIALVYIISIMANLLLSKLAVTSCRLIEYNNYETHAGGFVMKINNRLSSIQEYHFQKLDIIKKKLIAEGKSIVDMSIGDPDLQVNEKIIDGLIDGLKVKNFNKYPPYEGIKDLKLQIIKYYNETFSVKLDLDEVIVLIGTKEGINNIIPAVCNFGDYVIIPEPGYPVYETSSYLWGAVPYKIPLTENNDYLPKVSNIPRNVLSKSKLFVVNYPNNPTGAVANEEFYKDMIEFCAENNIILFNDGAYNEILKEKEKPLSLLTFDKNKQCVEFGSFSKTYNMTGFRIGYAVGNREVIASLLKVKSNVDSGQFIPIQLAACEALNLNRAYVDSIRRIYDERRLVVEEELKRSNIKFFKPQGTFYVWCRVPQNYTLNEFCEELIVKHEIIVTPGCAFGNICSDYFRISLTIEKDALEKALCKLNIYK